MKKYGVVGTRFCGSTPLMFVLAGSKKVFALGESASISNLTVCTVCDSQEDCECPIWTKRFTKGLTAENKDRLITKRIKSNTKADVMIYSDKSPYIYSNSDIKFDGFITLFKSPEAYVCSMLAHYPDNYTISEILSRYVDTYKKAQEFDDSSFYLLYDDFADCTDEVMKKLCKLVGIKFRQSLINFDLASRNIHSISGNTAVYMHIWDGSSVKDMLETDYWKNNWTKYHTKKILKNQGALYKDLRWRNLSADIKATIKQNNEAQDIYNEMMGKRVY